MSSTPEPQPTTTAAGLPRLNACENEGCGGTMRTTRVTCGRDSGCEKRCSECGRTVEYGWGGSRVLYEGRTPACADYTPSIANDYGSLCQGCWRMAEEHPS